MRLSQRLCEKWIHFIPDNDLSSNILFICWKCCQFIIWLRANRTFPEIRSYTDIYIHSFTWLKIERKSVSSYLIHMNIRILAYGNYIHIKRVQSAINAKWNVVCDRTRALQWSSPLFSLYTTILHVMLSCIYDILVLCSLSAQCVCVYPWWVSVRHSVSCAMERDE